MHHRAEAVQLPLASRARNDVRFGLGTLARRQDLQGVRAGQLGLVATGHVWVRTHWPMAQSPVNGFPPHMNVADPAAISPRSGSSMPDLGKCDVHTHETTNARFWIGRRVARRKERLQSVRGVGVSRGHRTSYAWAYTRQRAPMVVALWAHQRGRFSEGCLRCW